MFVVFLRITYFKHIQIHRATYAIGSSSQSISCFNINSLTVIRLLYLVHCKDMAVHPRYVTNKSNQMMTILFVSNCYFLGATEGDGSTLSHS